ncbi:MAG: hypothetical protein HWN79_12315 [Candidatus Lokiarchaeota archaeon]|nr:hypothetical protein [Candidatus Lokiarchaeota archaeon]
MKKTKIILLILIAFSIAFSFIPSATPQIGTYTFHGASGNEKTLVVRTANNASLEIVFGPGYVGVLETAFGVGALQVGAKKKSLVTDVNFTYKEDLTFLGLGIYDATRYNTSNWGWTLDSFASNPDTTGDLVTSLYNPVNLTQIVQALWIALTMDVTIQNGAAYFAQLPTSVAQYLGAIVWEPKWENVGNTVVHNAVLGDFGILPTLAFFTYFHNCTETWTYDSTYGSWIGYKIVANSTTIYEFSIELTTAAEIPGFELSVLTVTSLSATVVLIFVIMKKKNKII